MPASPPSQVLCLAGHDPTGGAGIQADIETCAALGAHALTVITAHTVQDTQDVQRVSAVAPILLAAQLELLLADCAPTAAKVGLLGDTAQVPVLAQHLNALDVPVVLDPILRAGGGRNLATAELRAEMLHVLLPLVHVLTPNAEEARLLCGDADLQRCGKMLLDRGARSVLITGGDEPGESVVDLLFLSSGEVRRLTRARLPQRFHGAGCTLAAAIAAFLARGEPLLDAVEQARAYVLVALERAYPIGAGRLIPGRAKT